MLELNPIWFLFSLVAGYSFTAVSHRARYRTQYLPWEQVLFESAVQGLAFLLLVRFLCLACGSHSPANAEYLRPWRDRFSALLPLPYSASWIAASIVGALAGLLTNLFNWPPYFFKSRGEAARAVLDEYGGELIQLLCVVADQGLKVCVVLRSRKYYVGYVQVIPNITAAAKYVRVLPIFSGYRDSKDLHMTATTSYQVALPELVRKIATGQRAGMPIEQLGMVIPIREVVTAFLFDSETYEQHFRNQGQAPAQAPARP